MRDTDLYASILGIVSPWRVTGVDLNQKSQEVRVTIQVSPGTQLRCPTCDKPCPGYDFRQRSWRHLDTCQFKTLLVADVPRVDCPEHGVLQVRVPWGEPGARFTALMEALIIDWLKEASTQAVARLLRLSWDEVDGVMQRAVQRGLKRRRLGAMARLCVDETSFQRHHEYVTVVLDPERQAVVYVGDGRNAEALDAFWSTLTPEQIAAIEVVAMDLAKAYVSSTRKHVPDADRKIAFDRFHVASLINDGVNDVRKLEHRELTSQDEPLLKGSRYLWIKNPDNLTEHEEQRFRFLESLGLKVGRAWALKEMARELWHYASRTWAEKGWRKWIARALRSRLEPMKKVAKSVREHLWGILNAIVLKASNAAAESTNAKIQWIKSSACGFRNRERFRNAIYFHCGKLDLYPEALRVTHTNA